MTAVRFTVETTFDLPARGGILAPGVLLTGVIRGGMTLRTETTDQPVRILAVEFPTPAQHGTNRVTLVLDRRDSSVIGPGTVLVGAT